MIRSTFIVHCDGCFERFGPTFCSESHAQDWIDDRDEDYAEYGRFSDIGRRSEVLHKVGNRVICSRCVEVEIQRMKRRNDRLEGVLKL